MCELCENRNNNSTKLVIFIEKISTVSKETKVKKDRRVKASVARVCVVLRNNPTAEPKHKIWHLTDFFVSTTEYVQQQHNSNNNELKQVK